MFEVLTPAMRWRNVFPLVVDLEFRSRILTPKNPGPLRSGVGSDPCEGVGWDSEGKHLWVAL